MCVTVSHTVEYYSALKKESPLFVATRLGLEGTVLSEISHPGKGRRGVISLTVESGNPSAQTRRADWWRPGWGRGGHGEAGQRAHTSGCGGGPWGRGGGTRHWAVANCTHREGSQPTVTMRGVGVLTDLIVTPVSQYIVCRVMR